MAIQFLTEGPKSKKDLSAIYYVINRPISSPLPDLSSALYIGVADPSELSPLS